MDWEPVKTIKRWSNSCGCKGLEHTCGRKYAKWVTTEAMEYRRSNQLCLRCGNSGHRAKDCRFLPARRPGPAYVKGNKTELEEQSKRAMAEEIDEDDDECAENQGKA